MTWSEAWYIDDVQTRAETTDKKLNNPENGTQNKVHSTMDFLAKFDWEENNSSLVSDCIKEIQADPQLQIWFENLLKSGISDDFINKIKHELEENRKAGLDEETLKFLLTSLIAETIEWWFKIGSSTYVETLNNQTSQAESTAENKEATAKNKEATDEDIVQMVKEMGNICMNYRDTLLEWHDDVKETTEKKAKLVQQQLPEETRNQLREKGYDDDDINNYILLRVTLNEVKWSHDFDKNQVAQFESSVNELSTLDAILKGLDNACNIPDTNLSSFSGRNIAQTRTELFNEDIWNESLRQAKQSNLESRDYSDIFPEMWEDELITKYGNFLESPLKEFCQQYQNNPNLKNTINNLIDKQKNYQSLTEEEAQQLKSYRDMISALNSIKAWIEDDTKNMMEELCLISQIKWLSMCIWEENDNEFNFNKAREILDDGNGMTINWHIDWVDFSVRQNAQTNRLQVNSKFIQSKDKNSFDIGRNDNFEDSPFIMPSQDEIFAVISNVVKSDNNINEFESSSSYFENLQDAIMWKMEWVYKDTELAHHYITNKVKWEKVVDSSIWLINQINPAFDFSNTINQANNKDLYPFFKILNFNIENSTTEEKNKLNACINRIWEIVSAYRANNWQENYVELKYPPIIDNFLKNDTWLKEWNHNEKFWLISELFSYYSQKSRDPRANSEWSDWAPSKMIINDLYRDLFEFTSGGQSEVAVTRHNETREKNDRKEADKILENLYNSPLYGNSLS